MSTTDTQVLAALNAWTIAHEPNNLGGTLDDYAPETVTAMRAALDAANLDADLDRLREGIKARIDHYEAIAKRYGYPGAPQDRWQFAQDAASVARDLRALLDGEAKG